ncbi:hypothetical protein [Halomonas sp. BM-2019]|uniref:hypothetical protein n=1 Tax=Halomonas sp. BM-2019 TaxID=2811227 RepID=UPI001B3C1F23|nr:MAG: hypothetical protein J5F18_14860 [Halomonas sp. BM-2019]
MSTYDMFGDNIPSSDDPRLFCTGSDAPSCDFALDRHGAMFAMLARGHRWSNVMMSVATGGLCQESSARMQVFKGCGWQIACRDYRLPQNHPDAVFCDKPRRQYWIDRDWLHRCIQLDPSLRRRIDAAVSHQFQHNRQLHRMLENLAANDA